MVVDDNAGYRKTLLSILEHDELLVVGEASGGAESLAMIDRVEPDIVLMDVHMPAMDGPETTRQLKARRPEVGIVALTGDEHHDAVREMLSAGASGYVLKDADCDEIIDAVRQAARGSAVLSQAVAPGILAELNIALEREKRRSRGLREANERLIERVAQRHELVSRLGHELRTPVTVIFGVARTLAQGGIEDSERDELLERLVARSASLVELVERFESAVDSELVEPVDLAALVRSVAPDSVTVAAPPDLPSVPLNPVLARRILEELLDNAMRFTIGDSRVEVWIGLRGTDALVKVMDQGSGVPLQDRERIFEPLQQGETVDSRVHGGLGVGLSLARAAARAMEGDVALEASGPGGSTFVWSIPLIVSDS
jgi:signal transduction histidine kinase